ncbi:MAG TPA: cupin domain-containing protein [Gaiellaceae bacterium]|nr:cupin domain-containing protein [Gaiellaceae bacterium]
MELDVHPRLLAPGEGEVVTDRPERTLRILADLEELIVTWFRYEPGEKGPDPHVHHHHTDSFYVLEGEIEVSLGPDQQPFTATPGMLTAAPPDVVHSYLNASSGTAVFLNFHVPSMGFGDYIRGRNPAFDQHDPPPDGGRPLADAIVTSPADAETLEHGTSTHRILCDLPQLTAIDMTFQPEFEGVDPHIHADHVDAFYVLEGQIEFRVGDEPRVAGPGTFVAVPPGAVHGFRHAGPEPIRFLNLHAPPGGFVDRLRD